MNVLLAILILAGGDAETDQTPTDEYIKSQAEGWTIRVHPRLALEQQRLEEGLKAIHSDLRRAKQRLPRHAVVRLQQTAIWLEDVPGRAAQYHPNRQWLEKHGYNPDKVNGIELQLYRLFNKPDVQQTNVLLHELAHAYHHQVLSFDNQEIIAAYEQACKSAKYEKVLRHDGRHVRHYAMTNAKEFFAEMSEAYFAVNDFYPFVRAELEEYDPAVATLIKKQWNLVPAAAGDASDSTDRIRPERN